MQAHISARRRPLYLLLVILLALSAIDDYAGWRFLLISLVATWGISYLWARSLASGLSLQREMRFGWAQVGDRLEQRFTLSNHGSLPALWVEVEDHANIPELRASLVTAINGNATTSWRSSGLCARRGLFTLGPTTLRACDPFGLYSIKIHDPHSAQLMVTPPVVPLPQIEVAAGGRAGLGRPRPNAPERTVSASAVRPYLPGDSLRWIHWPSSARYDALHVRTFENTPSSDWWIVYDADQRVQAGEGARSTEEHAAILAASLADRGLRLGKAVGLAAAGETLTWLPPRQGDAQRWEILRALALITPASRPLGSLLANLGGSLGRQASLILLTPDASGSWLEALLPLIWRGAAPTVLLLDAAAFGGSGDAPALASLLLLQNIRCYRITPELLDRPEARPGQRGQAQWRISPRGRAIPRSSGRDELWRPLQ
jgi:uncharacterized protein (DUF58 family)